MVTATKILEFRTLYIESAEVANCLKPGEIFQLMCPIPLEGITYQTLRHITATMHVMPGVEPAPVLEILRHKM